MYRNAIPFFDFFQWSNGETRFIFEIHTCSLWRTDLSSHVSHDGWWRPDTIATEFWLHVVATKKMSDSTTRGVCRSGCCISLSLSLSLAQSTIAYKTRLWATPGSVSWSNHKSIYLPSRASTIKKFSLPRFVPSLPPRPKYPRYADATSLPSLSRNLPSRRGNVLKIDNIACARSLIIYDRYN